MHWTLHLSYVTKIKQCPLNFKAARNGEASVYPDSCSHRSFFLLQCPWSPVQRPSVLQFPLGWALTLGQNREAICNQCAQWHCSLHTPRASLLQGFSSRPMIRELCSSLSLSQPTTLASWVEHSQPCQITSWWGKLPVLWQWLWRLEPSWLLPDTDALKDEQVTGDGMMRGFGTTANREAATASPTGI